MENAIDSRMRIDSTTYSDLQRNTRQFYWHELLQVTIALHLRFEKQRFEWQTAGAALGVYTAEYR